MYSRASTRTYGQLWNKVIDYLTIVVVNILNVSFLVYLRRSWTLIFRTSRGQSCISVPRRMIVLNNHIESKYEQFLISTISKMLQLSMRREPGKSTNCDWLTVTQRYIMLIKIFTYASAYFILQLISIHWKHECEYTRIYSYLSVGGFLRWLAFTANCNWLRRCLCGQRLWLMATASLNAIWR